MAYFIKKKLFFKILIASNEEMPGGLLIKIRPLKCSNKFDF
jgi:hypothetical protein